MNAGGCLSALIESSVKVVAFVIGIPLVIVAVIYFIFFLFVAVVKYFEIMNSMGPIGVMSGLLAPFVLIYAAAIYFSKNNDKQE